MYVRLICRHTPRSAESGSRFRRKGKGEEEEWGGEAGGLLGGSGISGEGRGWIKGRGGIAGGKAKGTRVSKTKWNGNLGFRWKRRYDCR